MACKCQLSRSQLVSWPDKRLEDLSGQTVIILGGADYEEAVIFAERQIQSGAKVMLAFRSLSAVGHARSLINHAIWAMFSYRTLIHCAVNRWIEPCNSSTTILVRLDGVILLPQKPNGEYGYSLTTANDEDVKNFVRDEVVAPVAFASSFARNLSLVQQMRAARHRLCHQP